MLDGHGRLRESRSRNNIGLIATVFDYLGTGEVTKIRRRLEGTAAGGDEYVEMHLGRQLAGAALLLDRMLGSR